MHTNASMNDRASILEQLFAAGDAGDLDRFDELLDEEVIIHAPFGLSTTGRDAERDSWSRAKLAMPDLRHEFQVVLRDGSMESARCVVTGTMNGEYGSIHAVNAPFRIDQALFSRIRNGKIEELWEIVDTESLLHQLRANSPDK
jgi:ketosteroid isomerase-like protein